MNIKNLSRKLLLLVALSSCSGFKITKGDICKEIPFIDAPEGYCATNTHPVTSKHIPAKEWADFRTTALMISPEFYTEIKKNWLKACRKDEECVKQLHSIDSVIQALDQLTKRIIK